MGSIRRTGRAVVKIDSAERQLRQADTDRHGLVLPIFDEAPQEPVRGSTWAVLDAEHFRIRMYDGARIRELIAGGGEPGPPGPPGPPGSGSRPILLEGGLNPIPELRELRCTITEGFGRFYANYPFLQCSEMILCYGEMPGVGPLFSLFSWPGQVRGYFSEPGPWFPKDTLYWSQADKQLKYREAASGTLYRVQFST